MSPVPSTVAVVRCTTYEPTLVEGAVRRGLELIGGAFARPGERLLLKPNVLVGDGPGRASTTHPEVFRGVARCLQAAGVELVYGDAGAIGSTAANMRRCGIAAVADELGIRLADFDGGREVSFPESPSLKRFLVAAGALEADGLVSLPKAKTHGFLRVTGAVKNQLGCVPGLTKAELHLRVPEPADFARMLVALNLLLRPRLFVMDAIVAMERNGPRGGDPFPMGLILLSRDPVALDATFCRLIGLDPGLVETNVEGAKHGLGYWREDEIDPGGRSRRRARAAGVPRRPVPQILVGLEPVAAAQATPLPAAGDRPRPLRPLRRLRRRVPRAAARGGVARGGPCAAAPVRLRQVHPLLLLPGDLPRAGRLGAHAARREAAREGVGRVGARRPRRCATPFRGVRRRQKGSDFRSTCRRFLG